MRIRRFTANVHHTLVSVCARCQHQRAPRQQQFLCPYLHRGAELVRPLHQQTACMSDVSRTFRHASTWDQRYRAARLSRRLIPKYRQYYRLIASPTRGSYSVIVAVYRIRLHRIGATNHSFRKEPTMTLEKVQYTAKAHTRMARTAPLTATMVASTSSFRLLAPRALAPIPRSTTHLRPNSFFHEGE